MLTKLVVRNFKRFDAVEIELGHPVVFVGPNNSGKTSALQALALWEIGLKRWNEKRAGQKAPEKRPGVAINRRDLIAVPVPNAKLLWRDLHVRDVGIAEGKQKTRNIRIEITVEGVTEGKGWRCGFEFDFANEESFYCRPLRLSGASNAQRMPVPEAVAGLNMAFLPPMSGLAANETRLDSGAINVRVGEGRTAEVLRNLCYRILEKNAGKWEALREHIKRLFGCDLDPPEYVTERGEIVMSYHEGSNQLDLSSGGRGMQQTMLLLAYMYAHPGSVLLLDEPDAHLEILRQRQIYQLLTDVAAKLDSQIIAASHSEVLLNEAAGKDMVIAFVGKPHRIDDRGRQVLKALRDIGFEDYYLAEQTGWVLYLEGSTDLAILRAFAEKSGHKQAMRALERPFVRYVGNQPAEVRRHFHGLREAVPGLVGIAIFDRLDVPLPSDLGAKGLTWERREVENYFCSKGTLLAYARAGAEQDAPGPLFSSAEAERRVEAMNQAIREIEEALAKLGKGSPWDKDAKVSDDFLTPLFRTYFAKLGLPNLMAKKDFCDLVRYVPDDEIDREIQEKLDAIVEVANSVTPG